MSEGDRVFAVNILSYIWTCKVFLPDLVKNGDGGQGGGHLVNVASILGHSGVRLACKLFSIGVN